ncbi:MAG: hypothetical protein AAGF74_02720 [Pseudomonadota bacterium]
MLASAALCLTLYDIASLHAGLVGGLLADRRNYYEGREDVLAGEMRRLAGEDGRSALIAMQNAYRDVAAMDGEMFMQALKDCDANYGLRSR